MSGSFSPPVVFGALAAGQQNLSLFDTVNNAIAAYINTREITQDTLVNRPAAGISGRFFFATDTGALFADTGTAWTQIGISPPAWGAPAFNAANFTGSGAMTWTVAAGDVQNYAFALFGKTMTVAFNIQSTDVAGVPDTALQIAIPGGAVPNRNIVNPVFLIDNGVRGTGFAQTIPPATTISIFRTDGAVWTASAGNTGVFGESTFEVQ